ncbi:MAG: SAF domain-containing protein, partial [Acidimicrobiales bacterium]
MDTVRFAWWRLRRSRLGWRCVVAVLALCTFASVRAALGAASRVGAVAEVVVAAHDLAPGAVLSPADLGRRRVPQALAPP